MLRAPAKAGGFLPNGFLVALLAFMASVGIVFGMRSSQKLRSGQDNAQAGHETVLEFLRKHPEERRSIVFDTVKTATVKLWERVRPSEKEVIDRIETPPPYCPKEEVPAKQTRLSAMSKSALDASSAKGELIKALAIAGLSAVFYGATDRYLIPALRRARETPVAFETAAPKARTLEDIVGKELSDVVSNMVYTVNATKTQREKVAMVDVLNGRKTALFFANSVADEAFMLKLKALAPKLKEHVDSVICIITSDPESVEKMRKAHGIADSDITLLADPENSVQKGLELELGLKFTGLFLEHTTVRNAYETEIGEKGVNSYSVEVMLKDMSKKS
mmetsp:Transcript_15879/g.23935  ORF Transcript_15879/g.23935 Transcript_15879/m.23935 type:complete len:333 (+) Transcript_15879:3-1001(+)